MYLNGKELKQVEHFKYLGSTVSWNCREDKEKNKRNKPSRKLSHFSVTKIRHSNHVFVYSIATFIQFLPNAQKHGTYLKPWNHELRHLRCGALGLCNEFHGEQKSQMKLSPGKFSIIKVC